MNTFFTQFKNLASMIKLAPSEKQSMRVNLYNYLEQHPIGSFAAPAQVAKPVPSPFFFFSPRYMVPIALLLVVGLSGGTAFAAQSSLPGNPLYAIKIHVNEPVQVALATTPAAKAEVNATIATTRLEEAETLAANGTLDATTTAVLASNFTAHAQAAQANTAAVAPSDPGTAAQLGTDFTSTLAAHGALLTHIGDDSSSTEVTQNSNTLALAVQQEADAAPQDADTIDHTPADALAIADSTASPQATPQSATTTPAIPEVSIPNGARIRTFAVAMPVASGTATSAASSTMPAPVMAKVKAKDDAKIIASLGVQASTSINAMLQDFAALGPSLDATATAQLSEQIAAVQTDYMQGNYAAAIRMAIKLDIYFKAGKNIDIKILSGLLNPTF